MARSCRYVHESHSGDNSSRGKFQNKQNKTKTIVYKKTRCYKEGKLRVSNLIRPLFLLSGDGVITGKNQYNYNFIDTKNTKTQLDTSEVWKFLHFDQKIESTKEINALRKDGDHGIGILQEITNYWSTALRKTEVSDFTTHCHQFGNIRHTYQVSSTP